MKKIIALIMVFTIISMCSFSIFAGTKVDGDKETVAYIGTVTIDGKIDSIWDSVPGIAVETLKENASSYFGDASKVYGKDYAKLTIKTLWNPDANEFYLLFIVEDKTISLAGANDWEKDSIELFIDEDNVREGALDGNSHQIRVLAEAGEATDSNLYKAYTEITSTGYIVEFVYNFQEAITTQTWTGFDVQVNDDAEGNGIRHACIGWSDPIDKASSDNTYWGQLYLSDIHVLDAEAYNYAYINQADLDAVVVEEIAVSTKIAEDAAVIDATNAPAPVVTSAQTYDGFIAFTAITVMAMAAFIVIKRVKN